jgi:hypothetical protein
MKSKFKVGDLIIDEDFPEGGTCEVIELDFEEQIYIIKVLDNGYITQRAFEDEELRKLTKLEQALQ